MQEREIEFLIVVQMNSLYILGKEKRDKALLKR